MVNFKIKNLSFFYPGGAEKTLDNINLSINQGEFVVVCGKSGSGKSTLLRLLKPELSPHGKIQGEIEFFGRKEISQRESAEKIGFILQNTEYQAVTHSVRSELSFGLENLGLDSKAIRLRIAEISAYFSLEKIIDKKISELSGGQKQLVCLASVLTMHPQVIIFDEPTSQLDPMAAESFLNTAYKLCKENAITVIITEHRLESVIPMADRVIIMEDGKIISDSEPREISSVLIKNNSFVASSMPVSMRLHSKLKANSTLPLTVSDGRKMISQLFSSPPEIRELPPQEEDTTKEFAIETKDLWFAYDKSGYVLKQLNLKIKKGSFFALLGANAAGKTTALSLMSGLTESKAGQIKLFGKNIKKYKSSELYGGLVGVLPQKCESLFAGNTVREDLEKTLLNEKLSKSQRKEKIENFAEFFEIADLLERHPYDISGGELQRAALAMILLKEPKIIFLDEPTKAIDSIFKEKLAKKIKELCKSGTTVVMVSHDTEFCAEHCSECSMIFDGGCALQENKDRFFAKNYFYTTAANKIAREFFPSAVTERQVLELCLKNLGN